MTGPIKNESTSSQAKRIIDYLRKHRFITSLDAIKDLGIISLQRRLSDLRESGYIFGSELVWSEDRSKHWKRYWLVSEPMTKKEA